MRKEPGEVVGENKSSVQVDLEHEVIRPVQAPQDPLSRKEKTNSSLKTAMRGYETCSSSREAQILRP